MIELFEESHFFARGLGVGNSVTSTYAPLQGYPAGSIYINNTTYDVWKCKTAIVSGVYNEPTAQTWEKVGNIKGEAGSGVEVATKEHEGYTIVIFKDAITKEVVETVTLRDGKDGIVGKDGDSITATSEAVENGVKITITDKNTHELIDEFVLSNGINGDSITASSEIVDDGVKITIKDKNTQTIIDEFTLSNGSDGDSITATHEDIIEGVKVKISNKETGESIDEFVVRNGVDGNILNTWKGNYVSGNYYYRGDMVRYYGGIYICLQNTGGEPSYPMWELFAKDGDTPTVVATYCKTDTATQPDDTDFVDTMPSAEQGKYIWIRLLITDSYGRATKIYTCSYVGIDGQGGSGGGDMNKSVYDTNDDGIVDKADAIANASGQTLNYETLKNAIDNIPTDAQKESWDNKLDGETDPTVPSWAKEPNKPSYTADEVNAYSKAEIDAMIGDVETLLSAL